MEVLLYSVSFPRVQFSILWLQLEYNPSRLQGGCLSLMAGAKQKTIPGYGKQSRDVKETSTGGQCRGSEDRQRGGSGTRRRK